MKIVSSQNLSSKSKLHDPPGIEHLYRLSQKLGMSYFYDLYGILIIIILWDTLYILYRIRLQRFDIGMMLLILNIRKYSHKKIINVDIAIDCLKSESLFLLKPRYLGKLNLRNPYRFSSFLRIETGSRLIRNMHSICSKVSPHHKKV